MVESKTEEIAAFMRTICENPHDDTPRLIFADWLAEQPDKESQCRAEFIRVQIKLSKMEHPRCLRNGSETNYSIYTKRCRCTVCRLRQREYYSGRRYILTSWQDMPMYSDEFIIRAIPHGIFRRGFIDEVQLPIAGWLNIGSEILQWHPVVFIRTEKWPWDTFKDIPLGEAIPFDFKPKYIWHPPHPDSDCADELPQVVYDALPKKEFPKPNAALNALSKTLLRLAREGVSVSCEVSQ